MQATRVCLGLPADWRRRVKQIRPMMNNKLIIVLPAIVLVFYTFSCYNRPIPAKKAQMKKNISETEALKIAREDAVKVYNDLSVYQVKTAHKQQEWLIDYELKDKNSQGGGPHYIISASDGKIISKRYEQ